MRITMICIGSTGDVRPYLVLGRELRRRGHEVSICAFANFASAVKAEGLGFKPVSGDVKTFMANLMNGANGVAFLKQVRDTLREFIEPFLADLEAATEDAQAIVGTYFGQVFQSLAEMRHVPYVQTQYFPIDPNPQAPIASAPGQRVGKAWNLATYQLGHLLISTLEKYYLSDWRQSRGMSPRKLEAAPCYELCGHLIPVLYAISPLIMPRPARWGENIHMTGFWLDRRESTYQPDPALADFLAAGEKPVYIGHQNQKICTDQGCYHCGKGIVVSEFYQVLEFVGGYRVVLIYNGDHLFCQKLLEGILGIPAVGIVDHGILGHQDLCHHLIIFPEKLLINGHQPGLSHSCTGLLFLKLCRLSLHTQCSCTYRNGSGGYQHYVFPLIVKVAELSGQDLQLTEIQSSCFCVDQ